MERQKVNSSMIDSIGYDRDTHTLEIQFARGSVYRYADVPVSVYEGLINAGVIGSVGSYFTQTVKANYQYQRID